MKVTVSIVNPVLVIVCEMLPEPLGAKPIRLGELAVAVQWKAVLRTCDDSRIFVVCPEQIVGVNELMNMLGMGKTVTT